MRATSWPWSMNFDATVDQAIWWFATLRTCAIPGPVRLVKIAVYGCGVESSFRRAIRESLGLDWLRSSSHRDRQACFPG